ncbi:MAG: hypothetical protein AAGG48_24440 [Planctomycetota bacterium]
MGDLENPKIIWFKGILFFFLGSFSACLILIRHPQVTTALLLLVAIWAFCRCYYFAFYVIEKYVDPSFRFAGLLDFVQYALGRERK